ncbi:CBS domain-containing protein CBSCBSPB5 [Dichanthelium oligosanthes]|uniref:CBS domain-containing protein CBSCBSPB5 n=1 Tax=Dichanthelium oligosanthes TaxID=888268 RepID=A0A1E5WCE9_9POAL|nr:CBS domain-containing protein CBSCBSPB5 [Dichanthelium oligosanthes]
MDGGAGAAGHGRRSVSSSSGSRRRLPPAENGHGHDGAASRRSSVSISRGNSTSLTGERTVKRLRLSKALTIPDHTTVHEACRRMASRRVDAVLLTDSNALLCGILTDKDITTRVIARELKMEETPVSKVMTRNPVFVLADTLAVEALQKMVQGKFRHLPVVENGEVIALLDIAKCLYDAIARMERAAEKGKAIAAAVEGVEKHWGTAASDGNVVTVVDVLHITHAAIATVGNTGAAGSEATSAMMQRFWDSAMSIGPLDDDDDSRSEGSTKVASEATDIGRSAFYPASGLSNTFGFKIQDKQGRMHRFNCDEDHDKVILSSDSDLIAAVDHARQIGWKKRGGGSSSDFEYAGKDAWASAYSAVAAGAALVAGLGVMAYLKRAG